MELCGVLTGKTNQECLDQSDKSGADLFEHRLDFMESLDELEELYDSIDVPIIVSNRSKDCGGKFDGSEEERVNLLIKAVEAGCSIVDIEIETEEGLKNKVIKKAREKHCQVIISMHDFKETPAIQDLIKIMKQQKEQGADIGKIVTTAQSIEDCQDIFALLLEAKDEGFPLVAFAMGKIGKITRPLSLIYGAPFTYVSLGEAVAPGQMDIDTMKLLLKELK